MNPLSPMTSAGPASAIPTSPLDNGLQDPLTDGSGQTFSKILHHQQQEQRAHIETDQHQQAARSAVPIASAAPSCAAAAKAQPHASSHDQATAHEQGTQAEVSVEKEAFAQGEVKDSSAEDTDSGIAMLGALKGPQEAQTPSVPQAEVGLLSQAQAQGQAVGQGQLLTTQSMATTRKAVDADKSIKDDKAASLGARNLSTGTSLSADRAPSQSTLFPGRTGARSLTDGANTSHSAPPNKLLAAADAAQVAATQAGPQPADRRGMAMAATGSESSLHSTPSSLGHLVKPADAGDGKGSQHSAPITGASDLFAREGKTEIDLPAGLLAPQTPSPGASAQRTAQMPTTLANLVSQLSPQPVGDRYDSQRFPGSGPALTPKLDGAHRAVRTTELPLPSTSHAIRPEDSAKLPVNMTIMATATSFAGMLKTMDGAPGKDAPQQSLVVGPADLSSVSGWAPSSMTSGVSTASPAVPVVQVSTPVQTPEFREALATQVTILASEGVKEATLNLNPVEMGPVSIRIAIEGSQARVDFAAQSAQTRSMIESSMPQLADAMRNAGLTLTGGDVSQGNPQSQSQARSGSDSQGFQRGPSGSSQREPLAEVRAANPRTVSVRVGGLDLFA